MRPAFHDRRLLFALTAVALLVAIGLVVLALPPLLIRPHHGLSVTDRLKAENDLRGTLVQALGGLALLGGLVYTARTFRVNQQAQVTDRYTKAVEQLGSNKLEVRLGAVYALERIIHDSPEDRSSITRVLGAFAHTQSDASVDPEDDARFGSGLRRDELVEAWWDRTSATEASDRKRPKPAPLDLVAAIEVLLRSGERGLFNLDNMRMFGASLRGADFSDVSICGSDFRGADLSKATFIRTRVIATTFAHARMYGVTLGNRTWLDADLFRATMTAARFAGTGGSFSGEGASFEHCRLDEAESMNTSGSLTLGRCRVRKAEFLDVAFERLRIFGGTYDGAIFDGAVQEGGISEVDLAHATFSDDILNSISLQDVLLSPEQRKRIADHSCTGSASGSNAEDPDIAELEA